MGAEGGFARLVRLALAFALASYACVPVPAFAAHDVSGRSDGVSYSTRIGVQAAETDLNEAWKAKDDKLKSTFTIEEGGTYYLSADLESDGNLVVDAAGADVTIRLDGHVLTLNGSGSSAEKTMLSIVAARSVTIDGAASSASGNSASGAPAASTASTIRSAGEFDVWAIASTAQGCAVSANDLVVELKAKKSSQRHLSTHAIRMDGGTLALDRCTVNMLMGDQSLRSESLAKDAGEAPSAVYATAKTTSVALADCAVIGEGTQGFGCDLNSTEALGNAYAVYSLADETTIAGGMFKASSPLGNATCLYGTSLNIMPGTTGAPGATGAASPSAPSPSFSSIALEADAGQLATGILSTKAGGVHVNAALSFSPGSLYTGYAQAEAALRSHVAGGFVFGACAPASGPSATARYGVLVMSEEGGLESANANGSVIGAFDSALGSSSRNAVLASLANALGAGCSVAADMFGQACFTFDASDPAGAVARLDTAEGSTFYPTMATALEAFEASGASEGESTVALLADAGSLTVSRAAAGTIDLNGHVISSLEYAATGEGAGLTVKNGTVYGTRAVGGSRAAVYQNADTPLTLSNVTVIAQGSDANVYGVYAAASKGTITLNAGTQVYTTAIRTSASAGAYGIGMPTTGTGPALVLDGVHMSVSTGSAGVAAYGISCTNGAAISGGKISVSGSTATTGAVYVLGGLEATDAEFDVSTTGVSSSSYGFGIWGRSSTKTHVHLNACTVTVRSAVDVADSPYACLLAATTESGTSQATWELSGCSTFSSASGMHMGLNVGAVTLGSDFSLDAASDAPLVVSQAKRDSDVGFSVEGDATDAQLAALAGLFEAKGASYYEGWSLGTSAEMGAQLIWHPGMATAGVNAFSLMRGGYVQAGYSTLSSALAAAESGDAVRLEGDASEAGVQVASVDDLLLDLNGHTLVLRAGGVSATSNGAFDALTFTGAGMLRIMGGTLDIRLGAQGENVKASSVPYEGVAVAGGGTLAIAADATVNVGYTGSTKASAVDRSVQLRGISVEDGTFAHEGVLNVSGSAAGSAIGCRITCGVLSRSGEADAVSIAKGAQVNVVSDARASVTANAYYAETTYQATTNDGPRGLREITVDPVADKTFYDDIVAQFRISASFDDPNDSTQRNTFNAGIYYANNMVVSHEGAWYDGLRVWAYSNEVKTADVGKMSSIVPAHIFVSSQYETLPEAYGIATEESTPVGASVAVRGAVNVSCTHGNASALKADGSGSWTCEGAMLVAAADDEVHAIAQGAFDLRDYLTLSSKQDKAVVYPGSAAAQVVKFEPAWARDAMVGENASFKFSGVESLSAAALDSAHVEASSFAVDETFALSGDGDYSQTCLVANAAGANKQGSTFARGATAAQAALFEDAYRACTVGMSSRGAAWKGEVGCTASFQIGDAVVARYANPSSIDLAEPTAKAKRADDQRQSYELVGWTTGTDENVPAGYLALDDTIAPPRSAVYHAVFATGLTSTSVTFENIFDATGARQPDVTLAATYGLSVADALKAAHVTLPSPADYARDGVDYRFVGWYPYSASDASGALLYGAAKLTDLDITLSVNGVSSTGLVLHAVYVAVGPNRHVVTFDVDGFTSVCVVDDGARPVFTTANNTNTSYVTPAKQTDTAGKNFTFAQWFVDANGNGKHDEGEQAYRDVLPPTVGDVSYSADWTWEWADVAFSFYVKHYDEAAGAFVDNGVRTVETTYEEETQDVADSVAKVGSVIGYGGKTYTLDGWSARKTDVEPVYDANHPLPTLNGDDRALSTGYSKSYYAVYSISDHKVDVSFYDSAGAKLIGAAQGVLAAGTSIDAAFAATGAVTPADKSETEAFLGWASASGADAALDGTATMIDALVGSADDSLKLYAVFGNVASYTVRLRNEDGSKTLYQVAVKRGATVASALAAANQSVEMTPQEGRYFAGWYTAAGAFYSLNTPVTGSANVYARYGDISVTTADAADITAAVTLSSNLFSTLGLYDELSGVALSITPKDAADAPLRSAMASNGYSSLKSYTLKLAAAYASGAANLQQGEVGVVNVSVAVPEKYRNAKVRAFWLGLESGREVALNSVEKTIGEDGRISVAIGNTEVGDEDEGGNFCVAYVEGGKGTGKLKSGEGASGLDKGSGPSSSSGLGSNLGSSALGSSGLGSSGLAKPSALSGPVASGPGTAKGASSDDDALAGDLAGSDDGGVGGDANGGADGGGESSTAEEEPFFADWESDAAVLVVLAAFAVAVMLAGLWHLTVVRQRRAESEAEAELPAMAETYAKGITF